MVEPINLNKVSKARAKLQALTLATENRIRFGRTRAEKAKSEVEAERRRSELDGAERES